MNRSFHIVKFLGWLISFTVIILVSFNCAYYLICFNASHQLNENYNQELLRVKIYGSSITQEGNTVSGAFSIIDSNGNEITVIERSWSGAYLSVEFSLMNFNGKYFVFPYKIYGKNRIIEVQDDIGKGTLLQKYYNDCGQCMLLGFGSSLEDRKKLYKISAFANKRFPLVNLGIRSMYILDLSECKANTYYSIRYYKDGRIKLEEI